MRLRCRLVFAVVKKRLEWRERFCDLLRLDSINLNRLQLVDPICRMMRGYFVVNLTFHYL